MFVCGGDHRGRRRFHINAALCGERNAMVLRDFQELAVTNVMDKLRGGGSTLLVMATGLGKTVVFAEVIRRYMMQGTGRRTLVLAHRNELIHQAAESIRRIVDCEVQIEMGDLRAKEDGFYRAPVIVSSVQTQTAGRGDNKRMHKFDPKQFGLVVIDEAHHAVGNSYTATLAHYLKDGNCRVLGVTATPDRADEVALGKIFDSVAFEYGIREGVSNGWLVPIMQRLISVKSLDFSSCRTTAGDLNGADLDAIMQYEETLHGMVYPTIELAGDRRGIVFAASCAHAERITEILNRHKAACAVFVHAGTPEDVRREMFRGFSEGRYQWLVNVGIATEGWDDAALDGKGVSVIAMMRPTKSRSLYSQMIGRGTRTLPNVLNGISDPIERRAAISMSAKPSLTVLDFCGNAGRHRLVHCVDALAGKDADPVTVARVESSIETLGECDVLHMLTYAEKVQAQEVEASKRRELKVKASYASTLIDPFSLIDLAPDRESNFQKGTPASTKQMEVLRRLKVGHPALLTKREASLLIDAAINTPTPKQAYVLERAGLNASDYNRRSASLEIDKIMKARSV